MIAFHVLGPLHVRIEDRLVDVFAAQLQRMLIMLLCAGGGPCRLDTLIDALWEGQPPRGARKTVQVYVHRLRRILGDETRLRHQTSGYVLDVRPGELDAQRYELLVDEARQALEHGKHETAWWRFDQARGLWRGEPYAEVRDVEVVDVARRRLVGLRLAAIEGRAAAGLGLGRLDEVARELTEAVTEHPFHEGLRGHLMLALYRGGRRAEALELYRETRRMLARELGIDPVTELRSLHEQILRDDPAIAQPQRLTLAVRPPRQLPRDVPDFVGRRADLEWLDAPGGG